MNADVARAYSGWLGQEPFDLFLTVTSAKWTHPDAMRRRVMFIRAKFNDSVYGRRWRRRDQHASSWVIAIERHKSGNPHSHALIRMPGFCRTLFDRAGWQRFATETGGFCKLEIPKDQGDVVSYCTKYIVKGGDLYLTPNFYPVQGQKLLKLDVC